MEDGTRERWEAAWAPFWDNVWRAVPDDVIDALCYDGPEEGRAAHLDRVDGALLRFAEGEPEWTAYESTAKAWDVWTNATMDALDAVYEETYDLAARTRRAAARGHATPGRPRPMPRAFRETKAGDGGAHRRRVASVFLRRPRCRPTRAAEADGAGPIQDVLIRRSLHRLISQSVQCIRGTVCRTRGMWT